MLKNFNIFRSLLVILIIFIPLYPKFPLANITGTYVAIRLDDIVILITILIWLIYQLRHRFPIIKLPITKIFIAYYLAITASFTVACLIFQTEPPQILLLHLLRRFEYTFVFFLAISAVKKLDDLKYLYIFGLITTVAVNLYAYGQKYLRFPVVSTMNSEFSKGQLLQMDVWTRVSSTFAGHYDLAVYLSLALVIIGGIVVTSNNIFTKLISLIIWLSAYHVLTLTASRVSIFAFLGGICLTFFLLRKYIWIFPVTILVIASIFNSKDLNQRLLATIPAFQKQFNQQKPIPTPIPLPTEIPVIVYVTPKPNIKIPTAIPTVIRHGPIEEYIPIDADVGVARSGEIRFNAEWPRAINAYRKNPLTGTGLGSITLATDNDYLRSLGESGLLGFLTFAGILIFFIVKTMPDIITKKLSYLNQIRIIFLGVLVTALANATLIDVFEASKTAYTFWIIMGIYYQTLSFKTSK